MTSITPNTTSLYTSDFGSLYGPQYNIHDGVSEPYVSQVPVKDPYLTDKGKLLYPFNPDPKAGNVFIFADNGKSKLEDGEFKIMKKEAELSSLPETEFKHNVYLNKTKLDSPYYDINVTDTDDKRQLNIRSSDLSTKYYGANKNFTVVPNNVTTNGNTVLKINSSIDFNKALEVNTYLNPLGDAPELNWGKLVDEIKTEVTISAGTQASPSTITTTTTFTYLDGSSTTVPTTTNNPNTLATASTTTTTVSNVQLDKYLKNYYFRTSTLSNNSNPVVISSTSNFDGSTVSVFNYSSGSRFKNGTKDAIFEVTSIVSQQPPVSYQTLKNTFFSNVTTETVDTLSKCFFYYSILSDGMILVFLVRDKSQLPIQGLNKGATQSSNQMRYIGCISTNRFRLIEGGTSNSLSSQAESDGTGVPATWNLSSELTQFKANDKLQLWYMLGTNSFASTDVLTDTFSLSSMQAQPVPNPVPDNYTITGSAKLKFGGSDLFEVNYKKIKKTTTNGTGTTTTYNDVTDELNAYLVDTLIRSDDLEILCKQRNDIKTSAAKSNQLNTDTPCTLGVGSVILTLRTDTPKYFVYLCTSLKTGTNDGYDIVPNIGFNKLRAKNDTIYTLIDWSQQRYFDSLGDLRRLTTTTVQYNELPDNKKLDNCLSLYLNRMYRIQTSWSYLAKIGTKYSFINPNQSGSLTETNFIPTEIVEVVNTVSNVLKKEYKGPCVSFLSNGKDSNIYGLTDNSNTPDLNRWACFPYTGYVLYKAFNNPPVPITYNRTITAETTDTVFDISLDSAANSVNTMDSRIIRISTTNSQYEPDNNGLLEVGTIVNPIISRKQIIQMVEAARKNINELFTFTVFDQFSRYPTDPSKFVNINSQSKFKVPVEISRVELQSTLSGPELKLLLGTPVPFKDVVLLIQQIKNLASNIYMILSSNNTLTTQLTEFKSNLYNPSFLPSPNNYNLLINSLTSNNYISIINLLVSYPFNNIVQKVLGNQDTKTKLKDFLTTIQTRYNTDPSSDVGSALSQYSELYSLTLKLEKLVNQSITLSSAAANIKNILSTYSFPQNPSQDTLEDLLKQLFLVVSGSMDTSATSNTLIELYGKIYNKVVANMSNYNYVTISGSAPAAGDSAYHINPTVSISSSSPLFTTNDIVFNLGKPDASNSPKEDSTQFGQRLLIQRGIDCLINLSSVFTAKDIQYLPVITSNDINNNMSTPSFLDRMSTFIANLYKVLKNNPIVINTGSTPTNPPKATQYEILFSIVKKLRSIFYDIQTTTDANGNITETSVNQVNLSGISKSELLDAYSLFDNLWSYWTTPLPSNLETIKMQGLNFFLNQTYQEQSNSGGQTTTTTFKLYKKYKEFDVLLKTNREMFMLGLLYIMNKLNESLLDSSSVNQATARVSLSRLLQDKPVRPVAEVVIPVKVVLDVTNQQSTIDKPLFSLQIRDSDSAFDLVRTQLSNSNAPNKQWYDSFVSDVMKFRKNPSQEYLLVNSIIQDELLRVPIQHILAKLCSMDSIGLTVTYNNVTTPTLSNNVYNSYRTQGENNTNDPEPSLDSVSGFNFYSSQSFDNNYNYSIPNANYDNVTITPAIAALGDYIYNPIDYTGGIVNPNEQTPGSLNPSTTNPNTSGNGTDNTTYNSQLTNQPYDSEFMEKMDSLVYNMLHCVCIPKVDRIRPEDAWAKYNALYKGTLIDGKYPGQSLRCLAPVFEPTMWIADDINQTFMNDRLSRNETTFETQFIPCYSRISYDDNDGKDQTSGESLEKRLDIIKKGDEEKTGFSSYTFVVGSLNPDPLPSQGYIKIHSGSSLEQKQARLNAIESVVINVPTLLMDIPVDSPLKFGITIRWRLIGNPTDPSKRRFEPEYVGISFNGQDLDVDRNASGATVISGPTPAPTGVPDDAYINNYATDDRTRYILGQLKQLRQTLVSNLIELKNSEKYQELLSS